MAEFWQLSRVLWKSSFVLDWHSRQGRRTWLVLGLVLICIVPNVSLTYWQAIQSFGQGMDAQVLVSGMLSGVLVICLMVLFFFPSVFYYSKDLPVLLALPVRPWVIVLAKSCLVFGSQAALGLLFIVPVLAAWIVYAGGFVNVLISLFGLLSVAIVPLCVFGSAILVLVRLLGRHLSQDRFTLVFGLAALVMVLLITVTTSSAGSDSWLVSLGSSIFFPLRFLAGWLVSHSVWDGLAWVGLNAVCLGIYFVLANRLYLAGAMASEGSGSQKSYKASRFGNGRSVSMALLVNENRMLVRTPAWLMNCVLAQFILPVMLVVMFVAVPDMEELAGLAASLPSVPAVWLQVGLVSALLFGSLNFIASTAFSRMGQNLWWMHAVPAGMSTQIRMKGVLAFLYSMAASLLMLALMVWVAAPGIVSILLAVVGVTVGCAFSAGLGLLIDGFHPKLVWTDEVQAVKQNFNGMLHLLGCWLLSAGQIGLVVWTGNTALIWVLFGILLILSILGYRFLPVLISRWLKNRI